MTCPVRLTLAPHLGLREHAAGGSVGGGARPRLRRLEAGVKVLFEDHPE